MIYPYACDACGTRVLLGRPMDDRDLAVLCGHVTPKKTTAVVYVAEPEPKVHLAPAGVTVIGGLPTDLVVRRRSIPMRREFATTVGLHFHGVGFTRGPAIMRDRIAAGHPGQATNWGVERAADYPGLAEGDD